MNRATIRPVRQFTARIARLSELPEGRSAAEFAEPPPTAFAPGQFFLAQTAGLLRLPLFPEPLEPEGWQAELPPALAGLQAGDVLDLLGACGRPALPEGGAANVLLVAGGAGLARLRPLLRAALRAGAGVTLLGLRPLPLQGLPAEVEVRLGPAHLPEALDWAQTVYADLAPAGRAALEDALRRARAPAPRALAFCLPPAPCGVGACGACAVPTARGWRLACAAGPWFDLDELEK